MHAIDAGAFVPNGTLSPADWAAIRDVANNVRGRALCSQLFSRHAGVERAADQPMGGKIVQPLHQRRVPIWSGMRLHFNRAKRLGFPLDSRLRAAGLSPPLHCAIRVSASLGQNLERVRDALIADMVADANRLRPISHKINRLMPPTVHRIAAGVNTAFMIALIDALEWPDHQLAERFVFGFPIVGEIPDSGVFRRIVAAYSDADIEEIYADYVRQAPAWNARTHLRLKAQRWADAKGQAANLAVRQKSLKEHGRGLIVGPFDSPDAVLQSLRGVSRGRQHIESVARFA